MLDYRCCQLCPRRCGVDREAGQMGFCKMPARPLVARSALHHWEEPVIAGAGGAGAVFFSGCTLRCRFCQNYSISTGGFGAAVSPAALRRMFEELVAQGAECLDLVTPTHFLPSIIPALSPKLPVPVVYNCGGYERVETLQALEGLVDVYLPDLKYADNALSAELSSAPDYFAVATAAIREMVRQTGPCVMEKGRLVKGVLIRHLVLPGHVGNTLDVLDWIAAAFPPRTVMVSLMSQYVPTGELEPPLNRPLTQEEYAACVSWLELCGLDWGFTQELEAAQSRYTPDFDLTGIPQSSVQGV